MTKNKFRKMIMSLGYSPRIAAVMADVAAQEHNSTRSIYKDVPYEKLFSNIYWMSSASLWAESWNDYHEGERLAKIRDGVRFGAI